MDDLDPVSSVSPTAAPSHTPDTRVGYPIVRQRVSPPPGWPKVLSCLVCGRLREAAGPAYRLHEHCQLAISDIETRGRA